MEGKLSVNMFMINLHHLPAESNFCEHGNVLKPAIGKYYYNRHMGYVDRGHKQM
jgi:hypothetical protein